MPGELLPSQAMTIPSKKSAFQVRDVSGTDKGLHLISEEDTIYEQDILREPESIKPWLAYIHLKLKHGTPHEQAFILERACAALPRSYKLWKMYLDLRVKHLSNLNPAVHSTQYAKVNALFERALILLNKMPRIWESYLSFLTLQPLVTRARRTFDRALRALPLTQHSRTWKLFLPFAKAASGLTALTIFRRYLRIHPEDAEDYIDLLLSTQHFNEATQQYLVMVNNASFRSKHGKSNFHLWSELVDLLVEHASSIQLPSHLSIDGIIRTAISRFADQRGKLWTSLATYWINAVSFPRARDVFDEGVTTALTVRDFTLVFDSYVEFEESIVSHLMSAVAATEGAQAISESDDELDLALLRFERLMDRRPFLINDILLRQNPHNVLEWQKRVTLFGDDKTAVVRTYTDAIASIDPKKAVGKFDQLWVKYAKAYESWGDLATARIIMEKATKVPYKTVAELAEVWCEYAEMLLRASDFSGAMKVMEIAVRAPKRSTVDYFDDTLSAQQRLHKSWKVWSFYVDLVEAEGTMEETRKVYERIFELRIATPQTVVNYANYLQEHEYFEDCFKVYERGLDLFSYPVAFELWNIYLTLATSLELPLDRLRDLYETALDTLPPSSPFAKPLFLMYGHLEETRGLTRTAMRIYSRAVTTVPASDQSSVFEYYIQRMTARSGLAATRPVYELGIQTLSGREAAEMCRRFAGVEEGLGEIDRARVVWGYGAEYCDPRTEKAYWDAWERFEIERGNEDTFREMLRVKRSVGKRFDTDLGLIVSRALGAGTATDPAVTGSDDVDLVDGNVVDPMAALEKQARAPVGFVAATTGPEMSKIPAPSQSVVTPSAAVVQNPDAIHLDGMDDD